MSSHSRGRPRSLMCSSSLRSSRVPNFLFGCVKWMIESLPLAFRSGPRGPFVGSQLAYPLDGLLELIARSHVTDAHGGSNYVRRLDSTLGGRVRCALGASLLARETFFRER